MSRNHSYWANALINKWHGEPLHRLCTDAKCREHFTTVLERFGVSERKKGIQIGREQMRLEMERKEERPDDFEYSIKAWRKAVMK